MPVLEPTPPDDDYLIVTLLSAGLAEILDRRAGSGPDEANTDGLLPAAWRAGFGRLWMRCAQLGQLPDWSDLDLLALCGRPMTTWPVALRLSSADLDQSLLDGDRLTDFAVQGARNARSDVEAGWTQQRVFEALKQAAAQNGKSPAERQEAYVRLRRFLIDHAVVDDTQVTKLERHLPERDNSGQTYVLKLMQTAYDQKPATDVERYRLCRRCHNVVARRGVSCGTAGCGANEPTRFVDLNPLAVIYEQNRATRRYIHDPGLVEARILNDLHADEPAGAIRVTPYPKLDKLDVLIEFLEQSDKTKVVETWGVDAKDQVSATLLGRSFTWPTDIECDRRYLALPMHRWLRAGYSKDLRAALDGRGHDVRVIDEKGLVRQVRARARELSR
ncbi:hypothetical protein [Actinoplanes sp. NPDC051851]|uniref:restriction endonuclease-related protein n=1 Tax=Actinoplanes sp. NPDC051851 TaxID=3154753 RepID=UPI00343ED5EE